MVCTYLKYLKRDNQASGKMYESGLWKVIFRFTLDTKQYEIYLSYIIPMLLYIYTYMYICIYYIYTYMYSMYAYPLSLVTTRISNHHFGIHSSNTDGRRSRQSWYVGSVTRHGKSPRSGGRSGQKSKAEGMDVMETWRASLRQYMWLSINGGTWWFIPRIVSGL